REPRVRFHGAACDECRHMAAATRVRRSFVEYDEDRGVRQREQTWKLRVQPGITDTHGTVMHGVAEVGNDKGEVGEPARNEIRPQTSERHDVLQTSRASHDVAEVDERIVLLRVPNCRRADEALE